MRVTLPQKSSGRTSAGDANVRPAVGRPSLRNHLAALGGAGGRVGRGRETLALAGILALASVFGTLAGALALASIRAAAMDVGRESGRCNAAGGEHGSGRHDERTLVH